VQTGRVSREVPFEGEHRGLHDGDVGRRLRRVDRGPWIAVAPVCRLRSRLLSRTPERRRVLRRRTTGPCAGCDRPSRVGAAASARRADDRLSRGGVACGKEPGNLRRSGWVDHETADASNRAFVS
jgi:hypothetical protein